MLEAELESRKAGSRRKGRKLLIITYTHMLQEAIKAYQVWASNCKPTSMRQCIQGSEDIWDILASPSEV